MAARFGSTDADEFTLQQQNVKTKAATKYGVSIVPKPVGEVTIPSQTTAIGERFPREKYIINLVHNMSNA
jgi:hypothetical protein